MKKILLFSFLVSIIFNYDINAAQVQNNKNIKSVKHTKVKNAQTKNLKAKRKISTGNSLVTVNGVVTANAINNVKVANSTKVVSKTTQNKVNVVKAAHSKPVHVVNSNIKSSSSTKPNSASNNLVKSAVVKTVAPQNGPVTLVENKSLAVFAVDADTGKVLFSKQAYERRYPASLTKMMTLYVLFDRLDRDKIKLDDKIYFSQYASGKPRSKLGVPAGKHVTVREAISALVVLSANDVATAVGEHIGGSEANFSKVMNAQAKKLKMHNTNFSNASGLFHPSQRTTAADMVRLGVALQNDFPQYYKYFSETSFNFRGRVINGHNSITANYNGATGLKTGYISQSGFNLVSSASRDQKRVFATVLGGKTAKERDLYMRKLLDASFMKIDKNKGSV